MAKKKKVDMVEYERFCYLKVKIDELSEELKDTQEDLLAQKDRPKKIEVPPYGVLTLSKRSNWKVVDIPILFKKIGKDTFLEICNVAAGKLKKAVGSIGFEKLEKVKVIEQNEDTVYYTLKRTNVVKPKGKRG